MKKYLLSVLCVITFVFSATVYAHGAARQTLTGAEQPQASQILPVINNGDLSIHFLELGNKYTGDCVYINYGGIDILIDAGSRNSSATTIRSYIDTVIQDNKLEFVIATHAHRDHIAGFYSTNRATGILDAYEIGMIIDFPLTNSDTASYWNYVEAREKLVENGTLHYTALQCYRNEDGARRIYDFGGGVRLEILYNYFYENPAPNENDYSVCLRILHNEKQYLFTGDLESYGEEMLVKYYEDHHNGLGHCTLFKAGHHGSNTSGSKTLLAAITPEYVIMCTCVGTPEYQANPDNVFPSQGFVNRIAPYTDKVFATTLITDYLNDDFMPFNGNIVFLAVPDSVSIICSGNNHKLKDSEWFRENRELPDAWKSTAVP